MTYGLLRKKELIEEDKARHVVFVDFGHSKLSAFVARITKDKASELAQVNDRHLGARDLDWIMY